MNDYNRCVKNIQWADKNSGILSQAKRLRTKGSNINSLNKNLFCSTITYLKNHFNRYICLNKLA